MLYSLKKPHLGFTLLEMLTVIAIIGILASLAAVGVFWAIGSRKRINTEQTIQTVNTLLQKKWNEVIASAKKETPSPAAITLATPPGCTDPNGERARVIHIKARLAEAFPISFDEIMNPKKTYPTTNLPVYPTYYVPDNARKYTKAFQLALSKVNSAAHKANTESAACLLLALPSLQDELAPLLIDYDNDGLQEVGDGWRFPLVFIRFGYNSALFQNSNPAPSNSIGDKFADKTDPTGQLLNPSGLTTNANWWYNQSLYIDPNYSINATVTSRIAFENIFGYQISKINRTNINYANYVLPVIVSAGPDNLLYVNGDLSYTPPPPPPIIIDDNIYSYRLGSP